MASHVPAHTHTTRSWSSVDAVLVVQDLRLVAELHRLAESSLGDRPGVPFVQADPSGRPGRGDAGDPLPALRGDLTGRLQQRGQVVDGRPQPAAAPTRGGVTPTSCGQRVGLGLCPEQRPPGVVSSRSASLAARSARSASSPVIRFTTPWLSSLLCALRIRSFAAIPCARLPGARLRSRTEVRVAPPAAWTRRPVTVIRHGSPSPTTPSRSGKPRRREPPWCRPATGRSAAAWPRQPWPAAPRCTRRRPRRRTGLSASSTSSGAGPCHRSGSGRTDAR